MTRSALLVGVSRYEMDEFPNLEFCVEDARALDERLERHWDGARNFDCSLLTTESGHVRAKDLRKAVRKLMTEDAQPGDDLLFYFSGHGTVVDGEGYLATEEAEVDDPGYPMAQLLKTANRSPARSVLIILDCCHAGEAGNTGDAHDINQATLSEGVTVLSASSAKQLSREGKFYSLFTELLLAALEGGGADVRGHVSAAGAYAYVEQVLGPREQRPIYKSHARSLEPMVRCEPPVPDMTLLQLPKLFRGPNATVRMDPTWEKSLEDICVQENKEKFDTFKILRNARLLTTEDGMDLYDVALESKTVMLTPLGKLYWELAHKKRI